MIIDCHGHCTRPHPQDEEWPLCQLAGESVAAEGATICDDEIRAGLEGTQLLLQRARQGSYDLFTPGGGMGHHQGDLEQNQAWARVCNTLIHRVCMLNPQNFAPVCHLPQFPGVGPEAAIPELVRRVDELGLIGCNLNPDPSGGHWTESPLTDPWWFPLL